MQIDITLQKSTPKGYIQQTKHKIKYTEYGIGETGE